jgi:hypothetical protein
MIFIHNGQSRRFRDTIGASGAAGNAWRRRDSGLFFDAGER